MDLNFLRPMAEQQEKIIKQNIELTSLLKEHLSRPAPAPVVSIDYQKLAAYLVNKMGDPAGKIDQANATFTNTVNRFGSMVSDVPKSVSIRGDFYGFTGWKPFLLYLLFFAGAIGFGTYSWVRNSDNPTIQRLERERGILDERILSLKAKNPKTAAIYFPEYGNR